MLNVLWTWIHVIADDFPQAWSSTSVHCELFFHTGLFVEKCPSSKVFAVNVTKKTHNVICILFIKQSLGLWFIRVVLLMTLTPVWRYSYITGCDLVSSANYIAVESVCYLINTVWINGKTQPCWWHEVCSLLRDILSCWYLQGQRCCILFRWHFVQLLNMQVVCKLKERNCPLANCAVPFS